MLWKSGEIQVLTEWPLLWIQYVLSGGQWKTYDIILDQCFYNPADRLQTTRLYLLDDVPNI